jgi:hypothetical protein
MGCNEVEVVRLARPKGKKCFLDEKILLNILAFVLQQYLGNCLILL